MKKGILTLAALGIWACSGHIQAKVNACAFDVLGKAGGSCTPLEIYKGLGHQSGMIDFPAVNAPAAGAFLQTGIGCERMALIFIT